MRFPLKDVQVGVVDEECVWHNAVNAKIFRLMNSFYWLCFVWWNDLPEFHDVTESCSLSLLDRDATTFKVSDLYSFAWWRSVFWIWLHYMNCRLLYTQYITKAKAL